VSDELSPDRFRILVCIDGSDESYRGLRYAAKLGGGVDADIILLYVRPADQGLRSGGLQVRVARENMLKWGLELPGITYLKKGLDTLIELGHMGEDWQEKSRHTSVEGDPLGDNSIEYADEHGRMIGLKLKVAPDIASGILGASKRWQSVVKSFWDPAIAEKIAVHAPCSVLVARELEVGHGHLICVDGTDKALEAARADAYLASRCDCPISLLSVAMDQESEPEARQIVDSVKADLESHGIEVLESLVRVGDPVEEIVDAGPDYSLIALSDTGKKGLHRFFMGSVAFKVLEEALNSVLIVR
jgi:nucleotide-binding universal stress UspA family protein